jgi:release factor glutamine methyltransferase
MHPLEEIKMNCEIQLDEVYQPAEDTFLLLKAALAEARPEDRAIEIGCGRALISREVVPKVRSILAIDINPHAVRLAKEYGLEAVRADLFRGIEAEFDLVIFNPPYLPTSERERIEGWLNCALDGGATGRDIISRFLEDLKNHLSSRGRALLLVSSVTGLNEVKEMARSEGLEATEVANERCFFEQLYVIKLRVAHASSQKECNLR